MRNRAYRRLSHQNVSPQSASAAARKIPISAGPGRLAGDERCMSSAEKTRRRPVKSDKSPRWRWLRALGVAGATQGFRSRVSAQRFVRSVGQDGGVIVCLAMTDLVSLPFYDLIHEQGHVPEIREKLPALVTGARRSILEIGAGTGLITVSLADWTPAEIFALEPSAGMRGVLLARLCSHPELLRRVTVLPCDAMSVDLDEQVEAVVMINVMYSLEPDYRNRLWPVLAAQLEPAGLLVFTWRDGGPPSPRPLQELDSRRVGRHTYTVLSQVLESDDEACLARFVYRISEGDKIISEDEDRAYSYRPAWDVIERELVGAGFTQADAPEGLLAWRLGLPGLAANRTLT